MGKAISLQERQMEVVREKLKAMELRLSELVRLAQVNDEMSKSNNHGPVVFCRLEMMLIYRIF